MEGQTVPSSVKVFGILNIVFGSFGLVTSPLGLLSLDQSIEFFENFGANSATIGWFRASAWFAPLMALALLILGIGLLMKKPWARSGSIIYAYIAIAIGILNMIFIVGIFSGGLASSDPAAIGGIVGGVVGGLVGLIYPILTIIFLSKPNVKAALERRNRV
ncbi:hypothetical protein H6F88_26940 [Oculatella sp. FACHB-28]|uniref:hypothetical protein n=1 Tax=Cyanophyceae TaxID=3028117 RepID=UPI0016861551|nr:MULTISPECIES: hypothetical protein [Cyanophyceae]MBD1866382.1 hypothetical protein [Cyanobacteria bacterium FACHB-471]MBD2059588.1 hypothetical protein [Oculatella sp. FACHB-28]MBD2071381.1 hypothetical protein [Leptolyngbya sp. FACHB-671]